jgi:ATP-dependent exoDNAse (exonuclease V) beta subunit
LMTIHKAKGLERPVVIVLLEKSSADRQTYFIEEKAEGIRVLRITAEMAKKVETLHELYATEKLKGQVDKLNKLYVALTRAQEELYVIGTEGEEARPPVMFLPRSGYGPATKPPVPRRTPPAEKVYAVYHHGEREVLQVPSAQAKSYDPIGLEETKRGELIHEVLAEIEFVPESIESILDSALQAVRVDPGGRVPLDAVRKTVKGFLESSTVRDYFSRKPGRRVLREQEFAAKNGSLFRADRVVIDGRTATVIDFKTGGDEKEEEYKKQVRTYMDIVREVFTVDRVVGIVAYVDRKKLLLIE